MCQYQKPCSQERFDKSMGSVIIVDITAQVSFASIPEQVKKPTVHTALCMELGKMSNRRFNIWYRLSRSWISLEELFNAHPSFGAERRFRK